MYVDTRRVAEKRKERKKKRKDVKKKKEESRPKSQNSDEVLAQVELERPWLCLQPKQLLVALYTLPELLANSRVDATRQLVVIVEANKPTALDFNVRWERLEWLHVAQRFSSG